MFEHRQARRKIIIERVMLAAQILAVLYLALHALIAWRAYEIDGVTAAILTFVLLGFGDLYWAVRTVQDGAALDYAALCFLTAGICFASWLTRGMFQRWIATFTTDMLDDFCQEMQSIEEEAHQASISDETENKSTSSQIAPPDNPPG